MITSHKLKKQAIPDLPSDLSNKAGIDLNNLDSTGESHFQPPISDLNTIRSGASAGATAVQPASLATVATSGSYTDLSNQPTIPTVNNATLTIQKNGTNVSTFTANASSNVICNITVPTQASDISAEPAISLTASRALVSDSSGKVAVSSITNTELGYVSGVTSAIQTQLNAKQASLISGTNIKTINGSSVLGSGNLTIQTGSGVPPISGNSGKLLTNDGSSTFWGSTAEVICLLSETYIGNCYLRVWSNGLKELFCTDYTQTVAGTYDISYPTNSTSNKFTNNPLLIVNQAYTAASGAGLSLQTHGYNRSKTGFSVYMYANGLLSFYARGF